MPSKMQEELGTASCLLVRVQRGMVVNRREERDGERTAC